MKVQDFFLQKHNDLKIKDAGLFEKAGIFENGGNELLAFAFVAHSHFTICFNKDCTKISVGWHIIAE